MRVLVTGWFSFLHGEATAGDLLAMEVAAGWLEEARIAYDVACSPVLGGGVEIERVAPGEYTDVVFVCGPAQGDRIDWLRQRFRRQRLLLLDVSLPSVGASAADVVFERDSDRLARPDLAISAATAPCPFVPVVVGHPQPEYGERDGHRQAQSIIGALLQRRVLATVSVDTRIDPSAPSARMPEQIDGILARADAVVTSRLHGLVLALRRDVPALAVDPVHGGGKVSAQARALGWPEVLTLEQASPGAVDEGLDRCLEPSARRLAARCRERAQAEVSALAQEFVTTLRTGSSGESR